MVPACAQVLDNVGVSDATEEMALLFEELLNVLCPRVSVMEKDWMEELGCTQQLVTFCLVDSSIGTNAQ